MIMMRKAKSNNENDNTIILHRISLFSSHKLQIRVKICKKIVLESFTLTYLSSTFLYYEQFLVVLFKS
jgi:hypothetical protein